MSLFEEIDSNKSSVLCAKTTIFDEEGVKKDLNLVTSYSTLDLDLFIDDIDNSKEIINCCIWFVDGSWLKYVYKYSEYSNEHYGNWVFYEKPLIPNELYN